MGNVQIDRAAFEQWRSTFINETGFSPDEYEIWQAALQSQAAAMLFAPTLQVQVRGTNQPLHITGMYDNVVYVNLPEQPAPIKESLATQAESVEWTVIAPDGTKFTGPTPLKAALPASKYRLEIDPVAAKKFMEVIEQHRQTGEREHDECMAKYGTLDCPHCGGSGHIGDVQPPPPATTRHTSRAIQSRLEATQESFREHQDALARALGALKKYQLCASVGTKIRAETDAAIAELEELGIK